jgi:hypothetical protein
VLDNQRLDSLQGQRKNFSEKSGLALGPTQIKRPERRVNHSSPSVAQIKNGFSRTAILPIYLHGVDWGFTITPFSSDIFKMWT